jgi:hypothetical protein
MPLESVAIALITRPLKNPADLLRLQNSLTSLLRIAEVGSTQKLIKQHGLLLFTRIEAIWSDCFITDTAVAAPRI